MVWAQRTASICVASGLMAFGAVACGDDDKDSGSGATTTVAPEERYAPDDQVAAGLGRLRKVSDDVAAAKGAKAGQAHDLLEEEWEPIEGTVKRDEPDTYATIEESFALLSSKDAAKVDIGAKDLAAAVTSYVAKHPG